MQRLKTCEEDAEFLIETANKRPEKLLSSGSSCSKWKSIHQKLLDLYVEESRKEAHNKQLKCSSNLLNKLVQREQLNTLVVNLYQGNEGYSLMLKGRDREDTETIKLSYDENELLQHIDSEELPAIFVDLLDRVQANLFYSGCVICEVRDYRRTVNNTYDTKYVLLKPTQQSLQCDINTLSNDGHLWTHDDLFTLESQLLLATTPPLCLDPSPTVSFIANKLHNDKYQLSTQSIKRSVKKYTQSSVNRKRKMAQCAAPSHLKLHDFVTKRRDKVKGAPAVNLRVGKSSCVDMWRQQDVALTTPDQIDVLKYAKQIEKTKLTMDNTPLIVEEFTFESERGQGKVNFSKLTILKRVSDEFYLGELYVDRDFQQGHPKGSTCKFPLGTKANVEKYIKQFREIFTEEGRRQVKITHQMQGQTPSISLTQATTATATIQGNSNLNSATTSTSSTASTQAMLAQAANLAASLTGQINNTPGPGGDSKKKQPIKLSLSISNASVASNSGNHLNNTATIIGQPTNAAATQLTLNHQQHLAAAQRLRHVGIVTNVNRPSSAPSTPNQMVSTPTANLTIPGFTTASISVSGSTALTSVATHLQAQQQQMNLASSPNNRTIHLTPQQLQQQQQQQKTFTTKLLGGGGAGQSATPPPNVTITMAGTIPIARRPSNTEGIIAKSRGGGQCNSAPPSAPATPTSADPSGTANQILAAVSTPGSIFTTVQQQQHHHHHHLQHQQQTLNNTATSSIPQNINIQNLTGLQGVNIANLSGLQNIQVSVSGMPSGIAVPLCLSNLNMLNTGSQPNVVFSPARGHPGATSTVTSVTNVQCIPHARSTIPTSRLSVMPTSQNTGFPSHITQQPGNMQSAAPGGMLSVPIGVAGNITQFMTAAGLKGAQGIRPGTPLLLSQVPGQQPLQLLSTGFPPSTRLQLNTGQHLQTPVKALPNSPSAGMLSPPPHMSTPSPLGGFSPLRPSPVSGNMGGVGQQFLQLAPQQSMTHLTIQGGSAVITPPRHPKGKKFPANTPPRL